MNLDDAKDADSVDHIDPLKEVYHEAFVENPAQRQFLAEGHAALLCIDLQYLDAARGHGVFRDADKSGVAPKRMSTTSIVSQRWFYQTCVGCRMHFGHTDWK